MLYKFIIKLLLLFMEQGWCTCTYDEIQTGAGNSDVWLKELAHIIGHPQDNQVTQES